MLELEQPRNLITKEVTMEHKAIYSLKLVEGITKDVIKEAINKIRPLLAETEIRIILDIQSGVERPVEIQLVKVLPLV